MVGVAVVPSGPVVASLRNHGPISSCSSVQVLFIFGRRRHPFFAVWSFHSTSAPPPPLSFTLSNPTITPTPTLNPTFTPHLPTHIHIHTHTHTPNCSLGSLRSQISRHDGRPRHPAPQEGLRVRTSLRRPLAGAIQKWAEYRWRPLACDCQGAPRRGCLLSRLFRALSRRKGDEARARQSARSLCISGVWRPVYIFITRSP